MYRRCYSRQQDKSSGAQHSLIRVPPAQNSLEREGPLVYGELSRLAGHNYNLTLTTMASNNNLPTDMGFQNATLPKSGNSTSERPSRPTSCARLEDEHDPTFVEMVKQCSMYEDLLEKAVSEFGNLPYCDTLAALYMKPHFISSKIATH
ncbi:hypothetical protein TNCV_3415921 [Trichonephila clavipes]|nr:hypothetical protein TNCV_3415921 [Trichonephila clavipes]